MKRITLINGMKDDVAGFENALQGMINIIVGIPITTY